MDSVDVLYVALIALIEDYSPELELERLSKNYTRKAMDEMVSRYDIKLLEGKVGTTKEHYLTRIFCNIMRTRRESK